ncbi:MAG: TaqI-like C-terminal specificity domain-containing protein, partial [Bacteroidota bacterium]
LSFITSNSWMRAKYGKALRQYFKTNTNPVRLLNFEDTLLFPAATVETNILVLKREEFKEHLQATAVKSDLGNNPLASYQQKRHIVLDSLDDDGWSVADPEDYRIKSLIEEVGTPLKEINYLINYGIKTGYNKAFIIKTELRDELLEQDPKNDEIIKRFLSGRDLAKYRIEWNDDWLVFMRQGIEINKYPTIEKYLSSHYERLKPKEKGDLIGRKPGSYAWYEIQDTISYYLDFEKPKLIWAELSDLPKFVYDEEGYYTNKTTFILTGDQLKYLMVLLNSKTLVWYFSQISTSSGMGTTMWNKYKVEQIPVVFSSDANIAKVERIGEVLLFLNDPTSEEINERISNQRVSDFFEDVANMVVYELYFEEEMKAKELDVLQFINEKTFPDISKMSLEEKKITIQKVYYELQQRDNPMRNRILVSESRSEIIRRINEVTK